MNKQKVDGKVYVYDCPHMKKTAFYSHSMDGQPGYVFRGVVDVTVEVDAVDKEKAIQDLRNSAEDVNAEATAKVRSIMQQIKAIEGDSDV